MSLTATQVSPSASLGAQLSTVVRQELESLRAELDARYAALESALLDPDRCDGLETLVLDLSRVATDEAEAAAKRVLLDLQLEADAQAVASRAEVDELRARLNEAVQLATTRADEFARAQASVVTDGEAMNALRRDLDELKTRYVTARREGDALRIERDLLRDDCDRLRAALEDMSAPPSVAAAPAAIEAVASIDAQPGSSRQPSSTRHSFPQPVDIQIGRDPAVLVELSTHCAVVLSPTALKPNHLVTILVPLDDAAVVYKGRVAWAQLEASRGQQALLCRAEVQFTRVDESAIDAVIIHYKATALAD